MAYEQKDNSGVLFKNDRKERESQPDYTGNALIGGVEYWVSAWVKESTNTGKKFFSFSYRAKDEQPVAAAPAAFDDDGDEVPF